MGFLLRYPNLELSLFQVGDLELCSVMLNLPDVPGQAGIGTHTLSLHKVVQAFPSPISLTTTRLCRQNMLAPRFLKIASNLSSFSLSHNPKSFRSSILMNKGILTEPDIYYNHFTSRTNQNYVNRTPLTYLCVNCMNQEVIIIL